MSERHFEIDMNDADGGASSTIKMFIAQLEGLRKTTGHPEELEWEIRLYQFMLKDPAKRLDDYGKMRRSCDDGWMPKREVARQLKWEVL